MTLNNHGESKSHHVLPPGAPQRFRAAALAYQPDGNSEPCPESLSGLASDYLQSLASFLFWNDASEVVFHARVSKRAQYKRGNLHDQIGWVLPHLTALGIVVSHIGCEIGPGWRQDKRTELLESFAIARERGQPVLFEDTTRAIRSKDYDSHQSPDAWPTVEEFTWLREIGHGIPLLTLLAPNTPWRDVHSHHTKRGYGFPREAGHSLQWMAAMLPHVQSLRRHRWQVRAIERATGIPESTMRGWL